MPSSPSVRSAGVGAPDDGPVRALVADAAVDWHPLTAPTARTVRAAAVPILRCRSR